MQKLKAIVLLLCFTLVMAGCSFRQNPALGEYAEVVSELDSASPQGSFGAGEACYEMGLNKESMPVFKDPDGAFEQFVTDYATEIEAIRKQFGLRKISKAYWMPYQNYGWQYETDDAATIERMNQVSEFLAYYANSFQITHPDEFA